MANDTTIKIPAVGRLGVTSAALVELLRKGKPGDMLTDEQLTAACGKPTQTGGDGYQSLQRAIQHVRSNHSLVWQRIPKANAIRCLNADETVVAVGSDLKSIRRKTRRTVAKLETVDVAQIENPENKTKATVLAAMFGAIQVVASGATAKKLEVRADGIKTPSAAEVLGMFGK